MNKSLLIFALFFGTIAYSQDTLLKKEGGKFMLGLRSTVSGFSGDDASGMGVGGQFRLKFASRLNSDWFFDYITTDIGGLAKRTDYHIGWSVLFYPLNNQVKKGKFTPYILAGHCFDYTNVEKNNFGKSTTHFNKISRFSSAVQSGLGTHYNLADNFDISLTAQYMMHLGYSVEATVFYNDIIQQNDVLIEMENLGLEGHLLLTLSLNIYIADLWSRK